MRLLRRLEWPAFRAASSLRFWVIRRFTTTGRFVLGCLVASAALGMDTTRTMAYQAFTFLLVLLAIAMLWAVTFRPRVEVRRLLPPHASVGERYAYRVVVRNRGARRLDGAILMDDLADPRPTLAEFLDTEAPVATGGRLSRLNRYARWNWMTGRRRLAVIDERPLASLPAGVEVDARLETVPLRRGRLVWTGVTVARPDPLGVFKACARVPCPQSVLVLPRRYPLPPVELPGTRRYQQGGVALAGSVGDSEEFVSLRDYRPGDPLRRLHWKSWAKVGRPIVKEYQEEFFVRHALVLDTFTTMPDDALEEAISVAASFACTIETRESLLDLLFVGTEAYCFTTGRGLGTTTRMMEVLAGVQPCSHRPFADLHHLVLQRAGTLSGCLAVLLGWDDARRAFVEHLGRLGIPTIALVVTTPDASALPATATTGARVLRLEVGRIADGLARL